MKSRNALISVYNKEGIVEFAKSLTDLGWKVYSSGGTAKVLTDAGVEVTDVATLVGGGAILGHRVVTLSREIHAALLARPVEEDLAELKKLGVPFIDLVCVDLYPLTEEIAKSDSTYESVIEKTDIGGPTMLRSAAKGGRIVLSRADQRMSVIQWLTPGEPDSQNFRRGLAATAEAIVADYALSSARYLGEGGYDGFVGQAIMSAKYGENAWQTPAGLIGTASDDPLALSRFKVVAGSAPSYNNLAELNRQLQTITHIAAAFDLNFGKVPHIAIGTKHGNPCGVAVGDNPAEVLQKMVMGDPRAIFGGLVITNFMVTAELAEELLTFGVEKGRRLLDGISAPGFSPDAIEMLSRKGDKCRFLVNPALATLSKDTLDTAPLLRQVRGGFLRQPNYTYVLDLGDEAIVKTGDLTRSQQRDIVLAWAIGSTSNSNTVTITRDGQLLGNGVGQQDRVGCCELAIKRATDAGHNVAGATAYSDSFFPFPDGPKVLIDAGIKAIWSTSGSIRDGETQELCRAHDVAIWQIPDALGRGFFGH